MFNNYPRSIYKLAIKSNDDTGSCNDYCAIRIAIKSWCIIENVVRIKAKTRTLWVAILKEMASVAFVAIRMLHVIKKSPVPFEASTMLFGIVRKCADSRWPLTSRRTATSSFSSRAATTKEHASPESRGDRKSRL